MFFLFKHKNSKKRDKQNTNLDKVAQTIVSRFLEVQEQASLFLQNKFERLSKSAKTLVVIMFCAISFGCWIYLIIKSFNSNQSKPFSIIAIEVPKKLTQNELEQRQSNKEVSNKEFEMLAKFRWYMDSLTKSTSGKRIHDSIIINRRGLIDSLTVLENMYQLQSSNK